ncbi:peptidoglycan-binding domain-containing protein [Marivita hallyeonensis]|uniref:Putative peptidoglycan binding domain-containing protein n=1 Tax=Marivita hallyeonensis TaxID=996342 RepID=A0A1M5PET4_9RHOB|nr:peptidoglycan-binding domain-containing protein [Marivita hallyeonensis]SHH00255.1 Putative peptidoglycan binding domain-containing protein [Marivita hallyeonensis]
MFTKISIRIVLACSVALSPAVAAANDALIGGIVGGIIGGAISNQPKRQTTTKRVYKPAPVKRTVNTAQREANRQTQEALNYFGFNAGAPDGVMGRNSRAAVTAYQVHLGYPATGQVTQFERDFLISSYYRAQSGGATTAQLIAQHPQGVRGLLLTYRDEKLNGGAGSSAIAGHYGMPPVVAAAVNEIAKSSDPSAEQLIQRSGFVQLADINGDGQTDYILDTSVTGSAFWCNAQACAVRVFASTPDGYERNDFQAFNVSPAMFSCTRGTCSKTNDGSQLATAQLIPQQPAPVPTLPNTQMASIQAPAGVATPVPSAQPVVNGSTTVVNSAPTIPNFFGGSEGTAQSLTSYCAKVNLMTSANGGFVTEASFSDPSFTLAEQMCLTRTAVMAEGDDLIAKVSNVTPEQVTQQCRSFGPLLKEHVSAVSLKSRADAIAGVSSFVLSSGMSPQQLTATAKICLSVGYRVDDMDVAIGSALLLAALGDHAYGELAGHHLSQGIGATKRTDLAAEWYTATLTALADGANPVFVPNQGERLALLQLATSSLTGGATVSEPVQMQIPQLIVDQ